MSWDVQSSFPLVTEVHSSAALRADPAVEDLGRPQRPIPRPTRTNNWYVHVPV